MKYVIRLASGVFACLLLVACSSSDNSASLEKLRISVLPDQAKPNQRARFGPLIGYLTEQTGIQCELVLTDSYQDLLDRFHRGELELTRFGGFTFLQAHLVDKAEPLVMRDVDARFVSYFLVKGRSTAQEVSDFKGRIFGFGSRLSTSGHLMPRYFLSQSGITPEGFFAEVRYSGAHDRTVDWVRSGEVDLGVANSVVVNKLYAQGQISTEQVRILSKTPPYPDYVWASRPDLPPAVTTRLMEAFLKLSTDDPAHAKILEAVGGRSYLPASVNDFRPLESIAHQLGLLEDKG